MNRFAWHQFLIWFHFLLNPFQPQFGNAQCIPTGLSETVTTSGTVLNSYYPGGANVDAGQNMITVGARRGNFDIAEGDLLLIIQMQGIEINTTLPDNIINGDYADGPGLLDRQGHLNTANNRAGQYEYAVANGPVSSGSLPLKANLLNSYRHSLTPSGNLGAQTFQVVRVANYLNLTINNGASVSALPWNGRTGGIVAIDVAGNLTIGGFIDVSNQGFRGGGRRASEVVNNLPGHRGEGIAGTPRLVYDGLAIADLGTFTYPGTVSGDFAPDRGIGPPAMRVVPVCWMAAAAAEVMAPMAVMAAWMMRLIRATIPKEPLP
ncbi:MAG: hypothetical protein HC913_00400 [Microscillaceae bacterium]|nr:hypothetical protein [Microscillaceae bacterium]